MSERRYKPEKYPDLSPYLIANGAQSVIDFLKDVFGASDLRRYEDPKADCCTPKSKSATPWS